MNANDIKAVIESVIATDFVLAESEDNIHFYITIVSSEFKGKSKMKQHKMIMELFRADIANETIHALSLKTFTPEKWTKLQDKN